MKNNLVKKAMIIATALILFSTVLVSFQTNSLAATGASTAATGTIGSSGSGSSGAMPSISDIENSGDSGAADSIGNVVGAILYILKIVAVGVALIMLTVLAIKYMVSSANDRASIKKHAVVYIVGAMVLFGAAGILQIIEQFAGNISAGE